jgi:hypothetical protein
MRSSPFVPPFIIGYTRDSPVARSLAGPSLSSRFARSAPVFPRGRGPNAPCVECSHYDVCQTCNVWLFHILRRNLLSRKKEPSRRFGARLINLNELHGCLHPSLLPAGSWLHRSCSDLSLFSPPHFPEGCLIRYDPIYADRIARLPAFHPCDSPKPHHRVRPVHCSQTFSKRETQPCPRLVRSPESVRKGKKGTYSDHGSVGVIEEYTTDEHPSGSWDDEKQQKRHTVICNEEKINVRRGRGKR